MGKYIMDGFNVKTTGNTIFPISKTYNEAHESAMTQELLAKEKGQPEGFYVKTIRDKNGEVKAYVTLSKSEVYYVLRFLAKSDTDIEITEFETEQDAAKAIRENAIKLFDAYEKEAKRIEENLMSDKERAEFTEAEAWYKTLTFEQKKDVSVLNLASESFGTLNNEELSEVKLRKFCHDRIIAKREARKKYLTKEEEVEGEYNNDGTYNPHALFNVQFYFNGWVQYKKPTDARINTATSFVEKEGFERKVYNKSVYYEKNNVTADDVRRYRKRLGSSFVEDVPMTYARSEGYRSMYLYKTSPAAMYDNETYNNRTAADYRGPYGDCLLPKEKFALYRCSYCGEYFKKENIEIDHVIPLKAFKTERKEEAKRALAKLGAENPNDIENLVCACKACNRKKGAAFSSSWILKAKIGSKEGFWSKIKLIQNILTQLMFFGTLYLDTQTPSGLDPNVYMGFDFLVTFEALLLVLFALKVPKTDYVSGTLYAIKHFITSTVFLFLVLESFSCYKMNPFCLVFFIINAGLYVMWRFAARQRNEYLRKSNLFYIFEYCAMSVVEFFKDLVEFLVYLASSLIKLPFKLFRIAKKIIRNLFRPREEVEAERRREKFEEVKREMELYKRLERNAANFKVEIKGW